MCVRGMVLKLVVAGWLSVLIAILTDARGICSNWASKSSAHQVNKPLAQRISISRQ